MLRCLALGVGLRVVPIELKGLLVHEDFLERFQTKRTPVRGRLA